MTPSPANKADLKEYLVAQLQDLKRAVGAGEVESSKFAATIENFADMAREQGLDALAEDFERLSAPPRSRAPASGE